MSFGMTGSPLVAATGCRQSEKPASGARRPRGNQVLHELGRFGQGGSSISLLEG
jgi:hypothetical protein